MATVSCGHIAAPFPDEVTVTGPLKARCSLMSYETLLCPPVLAAQPLYVTDSVTIGIKVLRVKRSGLWALPLGII